MSFGTWLITKLRGEKVDEDAYGNVYYRSNRKRADGVREERWVIYKGEPEASKVPPEWHAWLHHTVDAPIQAPTRAWEKPHQPNLTGTAQAYLPPGHDLRGGRRARAGGDYEAWTPNA
jgi:NADH:ubiquinone oxidoreductase subunit